MQPVEPVFVRAPGDAPVDRRLDQWILCPLRILACRRVGVPVPRTDVLGLHRRHARQRAHLLFHLSEAPARAPDRAPEEIRGRAHRQAARRNVARNAPAVDEQAAERAVHRAQVMRCAQQAQHARGETRVAAHDDEVGEEKRGRRKCAYWTSSGRAGSMNCGSTASMNRMPLGFVALTRKPRRSSAPRVPSTAAAASERHRHRPARATAGCRATRGRRRPAISPR